MAVHDRDGWIEVLDRRKNGYFLGPDGRLARRRITGSVRIVAGGQG